MQPDEVVEVVTDDETKGRRVREILADPVIDEMLKKLRERYTTEWITGKSVEEREVAFAKTTVLTDFIHQCAATMSSGRRATIEREARERRAASKSRGR